MLPRPAQTVLLLLLALAQTGQGVVAGATLCREETGRVNLEWSDAGGCAPVDRRNVAITCTHAPAAGADDHCGTCLDVPLPSETSLKSLGGLAGGWLPHPPIVAFRISPAPLHAAAGDPASAFAFAAAAPDVMRSVRLLI